MKGIRRKTAKTVKFFRVVSIANFLAAPILSLQFVLPLLRICFMRSPTQSVSVPISTIPWIVMVAANFDRADFFKESRKKWSFFVLSTRLRCQVCSSPRDSYFPDTHYCCGSANIREGTIIRPQILTRTSSYARSCARFSAIAFWYTSTYCFTMTSGDQRDKDRVRALAEIS